MEENVLKYYKNSYNMYENTIKDTINTLKSKLDNNGNRLFNDDKIEERVKIIRQAQNELVDNFVFEGGKREELVKPRPEKEITIPQNTQEIKSPRDTFSLENITIEDELPQKRDYHPESGYDVIPLPSKGECYKIKKSTIPVSYLTAYDENMMVSPNLYRENKIMDYLLKEKIVGNDINPMDLVKGDREAILLFLRVSGYGNDYPISVTDSESGKEFNATIDLGELKFKEFNLKGDENGWFDFELPVSKRKVKFRFPTHRDELILDKMEKKESGLAKRIAISENVEGIEEILSTDDSLTQAEKNKLQNCVNEIKKWGDTMVNTGNEYSQQLTNKLSLLVMEIDGVRDKNLIHKEIINMNVRDSVALRRYITNNEPGIDYNLKIERPESLGGGSIDVFLQLDQFIFLNISD